MSESLLQFSEVLLFGRKVADLQVLPLGSTADHRVTVVATKDVSLNGSKRIDSVRVEAGDIVLVTAQATTTQNGIYTVATGSWTAGASNVGDTFFVEEGAKNANSWWVQTDTDTFVPRGRGNNLLDQQLADGAFARIYGFSYEGGYYDLPEPVLFLVHGDGISATADNAPTASPHAARAPLDPTVTGVAAAHFQFADEIRVWSYDKADYTIRMDVLTGMFEQVLLEVFFEAESAMLAGGRVSGGRVSGGRVSGGRVSGGRVSGGRVSGGRVSGGRVSGSGD